MTPADDALDRLENLPHVVEGTLVGIPPDAKHTDDCFGCIAMEAAATVRDELQRRQDEIDKVVCECLKSWDFEHKIMERATEAEEKLEAAEAEVRRLTEGLRYIQDAMVPYPYSPQYLKDKARALLADSPEHPDEKMRRYMEGDPVRRPDGGGAK